MDRASVEGGKAGTETMPPTAGAFMTAGTALEAVAEGSGRNRTGPGGSEYNPRSEAFIPSPPELVTKLRILDTSEL